MNNKIKFTGILLVIILLRLAISCSESSDSTSEVSKSNCPTKTCGDFKTQAQAQSTYNSNKSCYKNLDADNNGKACENLPK